MIRTRLTAALAALVLLSGIAEAQVRDTARAAQRRQPLGQVPPTAQGQLGTPNYDIVLEVPELSVDSIGLNVEQLRAHLALDANAMNLVALNAGVDVRIDRVQLDLTGVLAEAYLYVDLDNVTRIVARVVRTLDNNPEVLIRLLGTVDTAVSAIGDVANTVLQPGGVLSQTVNTLGQTVQRTVSTTGDIVERTLDTAGNLVSSRTVGNLQNLRVLGETTNAAGQTVRQVQDQTGAIIEYTLDGAGNIASTRVVRQGTQRRR